MILLITISSIVLNIVNCYNLDVQYPIIYVDPLKNSSDSTIHSQSSYFGFSVLLIPEFEKSKPSLMVGAPRGNSTVPGKLAKEPGLTYQCALSGNCYVISPTKDSSADIAVKQIGMYAKVIQDNGWFGMSIAALHPTLLKICAPRTRVHLFKPFTNEYIETMQGMCYFLYKSNDTSFLQLETESLTTYNFSSFHWFNPEHGFSQNVAVGISPTTKLNILEKSESIIKTLIKNTTMILGNPTHQASGCVNIIQGNKRKTIAITNYDHEQAEFGYSVTSGHYFGKDKLLFASGAPAWKLTGKVAIMNSTTVDPVIVKFLRGQNLGEYFGASLASGDLNNDGFDDLIIGAPHYGNDNGRVYIYLGSQNDFPDDSLVLEGLVEGAQFGYSMSCGDLDNDGISDLLIGAPWEGYGVIYVYNGYSMLGENGYLQVSQRIPARKLSKELSGFGFSISNLVDIDNNGFPDVAVGAYKSSHAIILRAKPVEKTEVNLKIQPATLKNITQRVSPEFCLKNYKNIINPNIVKNYTLKLAIDPKYKRFMYDDIEWNVPITDKTYQVFQYRYSRQQKPSRLTNAHWNGCITSHFFAKPVFHNFIDPVDILLTLGLNSYHTKSKNNDTNDEFCKLCPILYEGKEVSPIKLSLPFEIDCGLYKVCNSDISVTTSVIGVGKNNTWEIGSGDISIEVKFQNHGEPAYLVVAEFFIPKGIHLRSVLPFCHEKYSENLLVVRCNAGNPLGKGAQKLIALNLDMRQFEVHNLTDVEEKRISINITVKSHTSNQGVKNIEIPLILKSNLSLSVSGKTDKDVYYAISQEHRINNSIFQHVYNVFKYGATHITEGMIKIEVPISFHGKSIIILKKPQFQVVGSAYDCDTNKIPLNSFSNIETLQSEVTFGNFSDGKGRFVLSEENRTSRINNGSSSLQYSSKSEILTNIGNYYTTFIDCSDKEVQCGTITCNLSPLKSSGDIGSVVLMFTLKSESVEMFNIGSRLQFSTKAQVIVLKPARPLAEATVVSTFYRVEEMVETAELNWWIIVVSVIIGLVILSFIIWVLYRVGFFQKKTMFLYVKKNYNIDDELASERLHDHSKFDSELIDDDNIPMNLE